MDGWAASDDLACGRSSATALVDRSASLAPEAGSAREARRALRGVLEDAGRMEWADTAELALSEVVTNAALHAHTQIDVRFVVFDDCACVEIRDFNRTLPAQRHYDDAATTGRGMGLVAAVAHGCGVVSLGPDGKVVWFCVDGSDPGGGAQDRWTFSGDDVPTSEPGRVTVALESMPATLWLAVRQHHDALLRELVLYAAEHPGLDIEFAAADRARATISKAFVEALEVAETRGETRPALPEGHPSPLPWVPTDLDLQLVVTADEAGDFAVLQDVLDGAERLAVDGLLLLRPGLPEVIAVRDWACEQVIAQVAGVAPSPWPGTAQQQFETAVHDRPSDPAWDSAMVTDSVGRVVAADDANRIVAISQPLADLLGWDRDELVGRRVVTLIPAELREAHVAGFSRHLTTGETHVLGVPVELPVLCRDGRQLRCRFLVEAAAVVPGRALYLAWLDPVGEHASMSPR